MNVGFYGATGSNDFGDYAMMIHNINNILNIDKNSNIFIFTPNKFCTLNNLINNMDINVVKERIHVVDEPKIEGNSTIAKVIYLLAKRLNFTYPFIHRLSYAEKENYKYVNETFINVISRLDVLIFNGGGYLQESWKEKNINFAIACLIAKQKNIPVYFLGNSIGPLGKYEKSVMNVIKNIDGLLVRDGKNYTAKLLDSYGYKKYVLSSDDLLFVNDYYNYPQKYSDYVIIEIMIYITKAQKGADYVINELISVINEITKTKNVLLVSFDIDDWFASYNIEYIYNHVENKDRVFISNSTQNIYEMFSYYKYADFSISFKYHPIILSLGSNVPCVGVICDKNGYYEGKMKGAFESCGIDSNNKVIHLDELTSSKLLELYQLNNNRIAYKIENKENLKQKYDSFLKESLADIKDNRASEI